MCDTVKVAADDSVRIITTGGGGWGDPLKREVEKVVYDLQCGLISETSALNDYGVIVSKQGRKWSADLEKTEQHRAKMRNENGHLAMFDRGEAFTKLKSQGKIDYPEGWTDPDEGWLV